MVFTGTTGFKLNPEAITSYNLMTSMVMAYRLKYGLKKAFDVSIASGVDWYVIFELHPVPTTRARDALDIEKIHQNGYRFGGTPLAAPVLAAGEGLKELL